MPVPFPGALVPLALLPTLLPNVTVLDTHFDRASAFAPSPAVSYAPELIPYGSHVRVKVVRAPGQTSVDLELSGVSAGHAFPAHVHTGRCGADPASSGPHYQNAVDPVQPSADPAYANDLNEVRMTVRTDEHGAGSADSTVAWAFRPGEAHSIVLHAGNPVGARGATDRVACVDVGF